MIVSYVDFNVIRHTMMCYQTLSLVLKIFMIGNNIVLPLQCRKLYGLTHCWLNILVATWRSLHRAMNDLKTCNVTLYSSFFYDGLALHCLASPRPWEACLFSFFSYIMCVVECYSSCMKVERYTTRILVSFCKHCVAVRVVLVCQ